VKVIHLTAEALRFTNMSGSANDENSSRIEKRRKCIHFRIRVKGEEEERRKLFIRRRECYRRKKEEGI
jgi:hypothetical protein